MDSSAEKYFFLSECNKLVQHNKHAPTPPVMMSSTPRPAAPPHHDQHQQEEQEESVRTTGVLSSAARLVCSSFHIPSCSSTPSSCFPCTFATTTTGLIRAGSDHQCCSKKRRTTMNTWCSLPSRSRSRYSCEEECFLFENSAATVTKERTTSTRAEESSAACCSSQSNRSNSGTSFGTSQRTSIHNGRGYPTEKQKQRRYKRRYSKVGKMFYENDPCTLLYLTSASPNFDSQHQIIQNTQIELYEQIINKMESSMNVG